MSRKPKDKYTFRFSDETLHLIDAGVERLKREHSCMDRTKYLEYLIRKNAKKK